MYETVKNSVMKKKYKFITLVLLLCVLTFICVAPIQARAASVDNEILSTDEEIGIQQEDTEKDRGVSGTLGGLSFEFRPNEDGEDNSWSSTLQIILILTVISLAPSILIMMTSFTRIIIVLHFVRSALGTQTTPPNQVLIGLALFLTLFIMSPVLNAVNETAVQPLSAGEISVEEAWTEGQKPIREFMINQLGNSDSELRIFLDLAVIDEVNSADDVPMSALIPAFILSELKKAFIMGFLIYLPFIVIDMVVSSTLMSMGMMMLPPTTISMPFKILLFIIADGWSLIIGEVVKTFYNY